MCENHIFNPQHVEAVLASRFASEIGCKDLALLFIESLSVLELALAIAEINRNEDQILNFLKDDE